MPDDFDEIRVSIAFPVRIEEDCANSLTLLDDEDRVICCRISDEDELTEEDRLLMAILETILNAYGSGALVTVDEDKPCKRRKS